MKEKKEQSPVRILMEWVQDAVNPVNTAGSHRSFRGNFPIWQLLRR